MERVPKSVIFMFSGQGSQYYQMGEELYQHHPVFRKWMDNLDHIVQGIIGDSILCLIYDERKQKRDAFQRLLFSNPAIFMVEYALAQALLEAGIHPDYVLGSSMGEYASATVAGVMGYEEAVVTTVKSAKVMEEHMTDGGMLTILHDSSMYHKMSVLYENSELAAVDFDSHFVVSGNREGLDRIKLFLKEKNIIYQSLDVIGAYHSSLVDPAAPVFKSFLETYSFKRPKIPYLSCAYGHELRELPKYHFWDVTRKPILFQKTIQNMEDGQSHVYLDLGPSGTLATFVKYNLANDSQSKSFPILTPFGGNLKNLEKVKEYLSKQHLT